jgi:methionyl aminopeptidase
MKTSMVDAGMLIQLKDEKWLANQRIAGKVAAQAIDLLIGLAKQGPLSLFEMDKKAEELIRDNHCEPTFLGYKGHSTIPFPSSVCCSINRQLVHGIANDYVLEDGDLASFDLGTTYKDAIADTATTVIVGEAKCEEHKHLVQSTKEALQLAIQSISIGKRLGVIGDAIWKHGVKTGHSVVLNYGGHGIANHPATNEPMPHASPFVANKANVDNGVRIVPGMVLAVEPLFVIGKSNATKVLSDGWTVECQDVCAHFEHSLYIHEDYVEIITARQGEQEDV